MSKKKNNETKKKLSDFLSEDETMKLRQPIFGLYLDSINLMAKRRSMNVEDVFPIKRNGEIPLYVRIEMVVVKDIDDTIKIDIELNENKEEGKELFKKRVEVEDMLDFFEVMDKLGELIK